VGKNETCDLSVIIVTYNTADLLPRCLNSIASQTDVSFETIVVDNASTDNTVDLLREFAKHINLLTNEKNAGFARANNQAISASKGKYIYFLNPDTEVHAGAFKEILRFMKEHPEVGIAGTRIVNPDGSPQSSVEYKYPGQRHASEELKNLRGEIAWVLGASMVARQDTIHALGGFDERFFLYAEDIDLCLRARKDGWLIGYIPDAVITHWGGQSEQENPSYEVWAKKLAAELAFFQKHYTKDTLHSIARSNILQAYWRIFSLKATMPFLKNKEEALNKLDKYRLTLQVFRDRNA